MAEAPVVASLHQLDPYQHPCDLQRTMHGNREREMIEAVVRWGAE